MSPHTLPFSVEAALLDQIAASAQKDGIQIGHECAFCVERFDPTEPRKGLSGKAALIFCSVACAELECEDAQMRRAS